MAVVHHHDQLLKQEACWGCWDACCGLRGVLLELRARVGLGESHEEVPEGAHVGTLARDCQEVRCEEAVGVVHHVWVMAKHPAADTDLSVAAASECQRLVYLEVSAPVSLNSRQPSSTPRT